MSSISLHGKVAVKATADKALGELTAILQPDSDDLVLIANGVLTVRIGQCDSPTGFHEIACRAVVDFCEKHASAGAVFDFDGSTLVVGPGPQEKKEAHAAHLVARILALTSELQGVLKSSNLR